MQNISSTPKRVNRKVKKNIRKVVCNLSVLVISCMCFKRIVSTDLNFVNSLGLINLIICISPLLIACISSSNILRYIREW